MKFNFFCNPFGFGGYAIHGRNMLRAMRFEDWDVACIPDTQVNEFPPDPVLRDTLIRGMKPRGKCLGLKLDLALPRRVATFSGKPQIFYTVTEVDRLPPDWVTSLNNMDEVWTTAEWERKVFLESGVRRPIRVVPEGIDPNIFKPASVSLPKRNVYRFLAVGKLEERKNYAALFRAYCEEFEPDEAVELLVHLGQPGNLYEFLFNLNLGRRHAPIKFSAPVSTEEEFANIYHSADAFVLPTRGEGWGLPIMEAMACGLPVITTGIGPMLEYAKKQTALLLDYELVKARDPVFDHIFEWGRWAEPNIAQLRQFMRRLFQNPAEGRAIGRRAAAEIYTKWTWRQAVGKAEEALRHVI